MNIRLGPLIAQIIERHQGNQTFYRYKIVRDKTGQFDPETTRTVATGERPTLRQAREEAENRVAILLGTPRYKSAA